MAVEANQLQVESIIESQTSENWDKISKLSISGDEWADAGGKAFDNLKKINAQIKSGLDKAKNAANKAKAAAANAANIAKSKINKALSAKRDISPKNSAMSKFGDFVCNNKSSLNNRLKSFKLNFDRKLGLNLDTEFSVNICGKEKKLNAMDAVMKASEIIRKNPGLLSGDKDEMLNALLKSDILAKMNILGLGATVPTCILGKTIGSLYGQSDGTLGPSLRARNELKSLMYKDPCSAMFANQPLINSWLSNSNCVAIISTLMSSDPDKAFSLVDAALGLVGQRDSVIGGFISSLAYAHDYNTRDKIDVLDRIFNTGKLTGSDFINIKTPATNILNRLDKEKEEKESKGDEVVTKDPVGDFNKYTNIISKLDPTWNYNNNYSQTKGNQTLTDLSNKVLKDKVEKIYLTGVYKTELKPEHYIAIINKFNKTVCECS